MTGDTTVLDQTDWQIMSALQRDGRASFADLARHVAMSPSAVAERVRRLEEAGVITGYQAVISPTRVGLEILAFVRLRYPTGNYRPFHALLETTPEIVEAHHVTGEDCFVLKVVARSMRHLEEITGRISGLGPVTTSVVYSSPLVRRDLSAGSLGSPGSPGSPGAAEVPGRSAGVRRRTGGRTGNLRQSMAN